MVVAIFNIIKKKVKLFDNDARPKVYQLATEELTSCGQGQPFKC